ncbi:MULTISPECIES: OmpA family protein [Novacetimonas]|nr:OmpA family protein [Novacetimonas hansenii]WEQ57883.1 OmpA family protein [Novacetimonas hansenii]CUW46203.1 hypothetical protein ATCC53582_00290 [Novacetimonas hansenii]GAN84926.1 hypothetical protein Gaha_0255_005 [Novacetimonas hansenii JCM 7643]GBQ57456.1 hypothetical protein AA0243_1493 [Novacetimonas hansenii NRIC 0243]GEC62393.1 hypothetical protein GHA01_02420 [Novacetimonas hansenii]
MLAIHARIALALVTGLAAPAGIRAAHAQVITHPDALNTLGAPPPTPAVARPATRPVVGSNEMGRHASAPPDGANPAAATPAAPPAAAIPQVATTPPANPVLRPPEVHVPLHPAPPPPEVKPDPAAKGHAARIPGGTRLYFGDQSADMNPRMIAALQTLAGVMQRLPEQHVMIAAYGEGNGDDASTPRRIALSRGLAARSVLIHAGVASTRIYVRAIGQPPENQIGITPDCIDVTRSGVVASSPSPS